MKYSLRSLMVALFGMDKPRQFSLAYMFLILFWAGVALALSRLFAFAEEVQIELVLLLITAFLTAAGAAVGGIFRNMKLWAMIGLFVGILLFLCHWSLGKLLNWLTPI